jgi:tryptophan synthase alpha chain
MSRHRIASAFETARRAGRIALMPYLAIGYPDVETTVVLAGELARAGADLFELGVPYSDPLADGPTVQRATQVALRNGVTPEVCLDTAAAIRRQTDTPILFLSYYNPIARFGNQAFCRAAARAGVDGLIVPDLPPEEAAELQAEARASGLDLVFLVAPTSTDERLETVGRASSGFVYCVSLAGVTGARSDLAVGLPEYLARVRRHTDLPLVVGFGITRPDHVREVARHADGAIVGSALIDRLDQLPPEERISGAVDYVKELAAATARPK